MVQCRAMLLCYVCAAQVLCKNPAQRAHLIFSFLKLLSIHETMFRLCDQSTDLMFLHMLNMYLAIFKIEHRSFA